MNRRTFLMLTFAGALAYPAVAFINTKRYHPPVIIRIFKDLKPGDVLIRDQFVLFETDSGPIAVSRRCTHLGCTLNYSDQKRQFLCPCHQSMFTWDGKYIKGPAKKDLHILKVRRLEGQEGYEILIPKRLA